MKKKKTTKNVLDYDPLAWLDDPGSDPGSEQQSSSQVIEEQELDSGYGFFADDESKEEMQSEQLLSEQNMDEESDSGYGFFDDAAANSDIAEQNSQVSEDNIDLGSDLTIRTVAQIKSAIDYKLQQGTDIQLSAQSLQKIDTAGLQLIYSLVQTLEKSSSQIHWSGTSDLINDAAQQLGLPELIQSSTQDDGFGFF